MISADRAPRAMVLPMTKFSYSSVMSLGIREMMFTHRTMEIPLPTPFSVIRSPIHMSIAEPAVREVTTTTPLKKFMSGMMPPRPKPMAMAMDSNRARPTVTYRVMVVIFLRPSSPSRCISSSAGMAMVSSCMMMEEVMYGVMFSAKMDICSKEPPVKASKKLKASPVLAWNHSRNTSLSTPGTGSCDPNRITKIIHKT